MEAIEYIVVRLNQPPFSKNLRLVDFDEKTPAELLQCVNDVFSNMDPAMNGDVRDENQEQRSNRIGAFLAMLKSPHIPLDETTRTAWLNDFGEGVKSAVYPTFHWALSGYDKLCKRAYLGKYLVRIDPPSEYMQDETLQDLVERYKELQTEFKDTHKDFESSKATMSRPGPELRAEIQQLEDERRQLNERIEKLQFQTRNENGFPAMLAATSAMRQEQDEEVKLQERMREQVYMRDVAEQRSTETQRRLQSLRSSATGGHSAEAILNELKRDVEETAKVVRTDMTHEINKLKDHIAKLERQRLEPNRTFDDVDRMKTSVQNLESKCQQMKEAVEKVIDSRNDNKLGMFRQTANLAASKLMAKEEEVESRLKEMQTLRNEVEEAEASDIASASGGGMTGPDGRPMNREQFKQYSAQLREKSQKSKIAKAELAGLRSESVILHRTEQILRGRDSNLEEFLKQQEAKAGVSGFRDAQSKLEAAAEQTAEMDDMKGQTLEEISELVKKIQQNFEEKKTKLKPLIMELKDVRKVFQDVEQNYKDKKSRYDQVAVGLATERSMLENECDELQDECLREESRYHYLNCILEIAKINNEKIQQEEKWQNGNGRFMPDFKCLQELYSNKNAQQENLAKALRKQQKKIKENEGGNMQQRALFADLYRLLLCKLKSKHTGGGGLNITGQLNSDSFEYGAADVVII